VDLVLDLVPPQLAAHLRPLLPGLAGQIADKIQGEVTPYAGPPDGQIRHTIEEALVTAFEHFVDTVNGIPSSGRRVDEVFLALGRGEALEGRPLHAMREAHSIGIRDCWGELHRIALAQGLPAPVLGQLGDAIFRYVERLDRQVVLGYATAEQELAGRRRDRLVDAILTGAEPARVARLATAAGWPVPPLVVPAVARTAAAIEVSALPTAVLVRDTGRSTALLCPAEGFDSLLPGLRRALGGVLLCVGWPVAPGEVGHALRWARRALDLVDLGVIARSPVVHCAQHLTRLWLHSEPLLRRRACQTELAPLLDLTRHQRLVLGETLCAWLESKDSAPALARRLDVHPQTVRHRLRRLRGLFGDRLDDPDDSLAITLALQASLPLWRAGHTEDGPADEGVDST
jgi:hypothetical protein